jgi:aconitase A
MTMEEIFTMTRGIGSAETTNRQYMRKNRQFRQIIRPRTRLSLGDLILAVSSCTRSSTEMVAAVADLLASGQVRVQDNGRFLRARVC